VRIYISISISISIYIYIYIYIYVCVCVCEHECVYMYMIYTAPVRGVGGSAADGGGHRRGGCGRTQHAKQKMDLTTKMQGILTVYIYIYIYICIYIYIVCESAFE